MAEKVSIDLDVQRFNRALTQFVQQVGGDVDRIVYAVATQVLSDTKDGWPVDTGHSKSEWWGPHRAGPGHFQIGNPVTYARVIEYGGYRAVGPRTVRMGGSTLPGGFTIPAGIYPRQRPAAPLRRALAKAYGDMTTKAGESMRKHWGR